MKTGTPYVSFWNLSHSNPPLGRFEKRQLAAADARKLIADAYTSTRLICPPAHDLQAPDARADRHRHERRCAVVRDHYKLTWS